MDLELDEGQSLLVSSLRSILDRHQELPPAHRRDRSYYAHDLDTQLLSNGFYDAARTPGMGALEAALVVMETAEAPAAVEVGASALIAPHLGDAMLPRPICLIQGDIAKAQRYLSVAQTALLDVGDDVLAIAVDGDAVEPVEAVYAYPFGRFKTVPDLRAARRLGAAAVQPLRQWWRVAIAAEAAGLMRAAVNFTVEYVKQRQMFGTTLGAYQAVQHRLAECQLISEGVRLLALKAAWSADPFDAAQAAGYAQQHVQKFVFDLHQFNGAMGVTNEHKLHFWTYRLRALQPEMGGANGAALATADLLWGETGASARPRKERVQSGAPR